MKINMMKKKQKNNYFSFTNNILYAFNSIRKVDMSLFWCELQSVPIDTILPVLNMVIPPCMVYVLLNAEISIWHMICIISGLILFKTSIELLANKVRAKKHISEHKLVLYYHEQLYEKIMDVDYTMIEEPHTRVIYDRAEEAIINNHTPFIHLSSNACQLIVAILKFIVFCFIIISFNTWIILALALTAGLEYLTMLYIDHYEYRTKDERIKISRKMKYFAGISENYKTGKDIRLYGLNTWIKDNIKQLMSEHYSLFNKLAIKKILSSFADLLVIVARDGISYLYLITMVSKNKISAAEFMLYFSTISSFVDILGEIVISFEQLTKGNYAAKDYRIFMTLKSINYGNLSMNSNSIKSIVFENVKFRYPGAETDAIDDVNFEIHSGESLAIVGLNGAGKTTLVKLLCGMYQPSDGYIWLDGNNQSDYSRKEYYKVISSVFQKISVLPFTIRDNVVYSEYSENRLHDSLSLSGLREKIYMLSNRDETYLVANVFQNAVDLSGGELQKLALSRAMYKNASILVLDEPTAALDPLAEEEMYMKYSSYSNDKISFFISHRLASTRFCNKILFLENGRIVESGSHSELLKKKGKYAELFDVQAKYYKNDPTVVAQ